MNTKWALEQLDKFVHQTELVPHPSPNVIASFPRGPAEEIAGQAQVVEKILERVIPRWRETVPVDKHRQWGQHREAALRARAELLREEELKENLGENAPELSAAELHRWIWSGAKSLWQSGHYREAIEGAIRKLNAEAQNKVGRRDVSEADLFKQAFTLDTAVQGKARLRRMPPDDSDTYKSVQRGAMTFAEGVFAGIRNPLSHEADQELSEQEALEYLAALSVLARWVDASTVEAAP
jgi:hypothetical protein